MYKIEICADSVASCLAAQEGGAHRVELCAGIPEGGTTPSYGEITLARELLKIKLHVIIRPRGGDFFYSGLEREIMLKDVVMARNLGANGIVVGCLTPEGEIDTAFLKQMKEISGNMSVTFHRAFDMCRNPRMALEQIIDVGCDRILTSGQMPDAEQGIGLLKELVELASDRIIILPGCGINEKNIVRIARETGACEFHFSARINENSKMTYRNPSVSMGGTVLINEYELSVASAQRIRQTIGLLQSD